MFIARVRSASMWALNNTTAYGAERNWVRDKHGRHHWIVAVKATFDIALGGRLKLADEQPLPALAPEYSGKAGHSSLLWDSDLLYIKPLTDVIVNAFAHAAHGRPTASVPVALRVGSIDKRLLVHGPRSYVKRARGVSMTASQPFEVAAIEYESAFGGFDRSDRDPKNHRVYDMNPIGKGFAVHDESLVGQPAPTIEVPGKALATAGPAGFGAVDAAWSPRRECGGTYDAAWAARKKPLLPDDFNELYGSSAPVDQRVPGYLHGGEPVELAGMTKDGPLRFVLPRIYLTYTTHFGRRREEHRGKLTTLLLLPEQRKVVLVWQSTLYVSPRDGDYLDETVIAEKPYLT